MEFSAEAGDGLLPTAYRDHHPHLKLLWREVMELEEDVVLVWAAAAPLPDLDGHAPGHDVPGGQVLYTPSDNVLGFS
jgi:hypothetical protein